MYKDIKEFEKAKQENPALNIYDWMDGKMFYQGKLVNVATEEEDDFDPDDESETEPTDAEAGIDWEEDFNY